MNKKRFEDSLLWRVPLYIQRGFLGISGLTIVVLITVAIFLRYVLKTDLYGLEEIEITLAMWIYFAGAVYGSYEGSHITADILSTVIKNEKVLWILRIAIAAISLAVGIFFCMWAFKYWDLVLRIGGHTPGLKIPLPLQRFPLVLGFVLMTVYNIYHLVCAIINREPVIMDAEIGLPENENSTTEEDSAL